MATMGTGIATVIGFVLGIIFHKFFWSKIWDRVKPWLVKIKAKIKKNIKSIAIGLALIFLSSFSYAADDDLSAITIGRGVVGNKSVSIGITDDVNQFTKALRTTADGYTITSNLPSENSFVNETTATSQNLLTSSGHLLRVIIGVADAGTTLELYDEADATCDANLIATVDTSAVASIAFGLKTVNGLCMKTVGHDTGNVTVVYK